MVALPDLLKNLSRKAQRGKKLLKNLSRKANRGNFYLVGKKTFHGDYALKDLLIGLTDKKVEDYEILIHVLMNEGKDKISYIYGQLKED